MTTHPARLNFYRDVEGRWRWRLVASNNLITDASTQGYRWRSSARRNARKTLQLPRPDVREESR